MNHAPPHEEGPIVAELGRAETVEEMAARKAEASRLRRSRQTVVNLVLSLVASLGIVLFLVVVVVRPDQPSRDAVDFSKVASEAQPAVSEKLVTPSVGGDWSANRATLESGSDGVTVWYIGFVTPKTQFISVTQGIGANATWLDGQLRGAMVTGQLSIRGVPWMLYSQRDDADAGNLAFAMTTEVGENTIILAGTASDEEFMTIATSITDDITELSP